MTSWSVNESLQAEAQQIINKLENTNVPPEGLNYFTVGDSFRDSLLNLKNQVLSLPKSQKALEKIIVGGFGSGKTHFLSYLRWHLERDLLDECIISQVDMSKLRSTSDFQLHIIQGMKPIRGDGNYATVLRQAYQRLQSYYIAKYSGVSPKDVEYLYGVILYSILGQLSQGWVSRDLLEILGASNPIDKLLNFLSGRTMQSLFEQAQRQANQEHTEFVHRYLDIIRHPNQPISAFEIPARQLSHKGELTDVIFKTLSLTGANLVVILVDELESLNRFDETIRSQILVDIRDFRDSFANVGINLGYPPIAFVCASTANFYDNLNREEPALASRWEEKDVFLELLSPADIDNLIFKLRELYFFAGYDLKPLNWSPDDTEHDVIRMRKRILEESEKLGLSLTTRRVIRKLLDEISRTMIVNTV